MGFISNLIAEKKEEKYKNELYKEVFKIIQDFNNFKQRLCKQISIEYFEDDIFMEMAEVTKEKISVDPYFLGVYVNSLRDLLRHILKSLQYINEYQNIWATLTSHFDINTTLLVCFVDVCEVETNGKLQYELPYNLKSFVVENFLNYKTKNEFYDFGIRTVNILELKEQYCKNSKTSKTLKELDEILDKINSK